jgi:heme-degrading monooxygenase HmoA
LWTGCIGGENLALAPSIIIPIMVFHPKDGSTPYYACIFTGLRRRHGAALHDEDRPPQSDLARHQPGYLGGDDNVKSDDDDSHHHMVISITYWSTEASMLKWRAYLEGLVENPRHQPPHTSSYTDYHIHVAKIEPSSAARRSGKVSPDRENDVAPSSTTTPSCSTSCHDDDDVHHDAKQPALLYHLPQPQRSTDPPQFQSAEPPVTSPTHQHHNKKKQKTTTSRMKDRCHLLTPLVDLPPVYDPTTAPLLSSSSCSNNNNGGSEPIIPDNDTLSDHLRVFGT